MKDESRAEGGAMPRAPRTHAGTTCPEFDVCKEWESYGDLQHRALLACKEQRDTAWARIKRLEAAARELAICADREGLWVNSHDAADDVWELLGGRPGPIR